MVGHNIYRNKWQREDVGVNSLTNFGCFLVKVKLIR